MTTSTNQITVVDNFLPAYDFVLLKKLFFSDEITWEFGVKVLQAIGKDQKELKPVFTHDALANYQFVHVFLDPLQIFKVSPHADKLNVFMEKLGVESIFRIKANLEGWKPDPYASNFHIDNYTKPDTCVARTADNRYEQRQVKDMTTGIYYLNTCNGYTEFEDGTIVNSVENRFVSFPGNTLHRGVSQTDTKVRIVINFNYWTK